MENKAEHNIRILVADASHEKYVDEILDTIREAAKKRGTGIAERTHEYVATKMKEGKAVIALDENDRFVSVFPAEDAQARLPLVFIPED